MASTPLKALNGPPSGLPPFSLPPSPPSSAGRVSGETNTSTPSIQNTPTPIGRAVEPPLEIQLKEHHRVFRAYNGVQSLEKDDAPQTRAREKLLRLSPTQFLELSTDIYDELLRREDERFGVAGVPQSLLLDPSCHPKRNQARQKLSTLAEPRFRILTGDVLHETERRLPYLATLPFEPVDFSRGKGSNIRPPKTRPVMGINTSLPLRVAGGRRPSITSPTQPYSPGIFDVTPGFPSPTPEGNDFGRPLPMQYQHRLKSDNMKGHRGGPHNGYATRREFDTELGRSTTRSTNGTSRSRSRSIQNNDNGIEYQAQIEELNRKLVNLEGRLLSKENENETSKKLANDSQQILEAERAKFYSLKSSLEDQLAQANTLTGSLRDEIDALRTQNTDVDDSADIRGRYYQVTAELASQRLVTDTVRAEALAALSELKSLSARCTSAVTAENALARQVNTLKSDLTMWKARYTALTASHSHSTTESGAPAHALPRPDVRDAAFLRPDGRIPAEALAGFQLTIDELLFIVRTGGSARPLEFMREVVARVRDVTASAGQEESEERAKARVTATANVLISAASAHADAHGLLPVGLVDAAAANLSAAVVEVCRASGVARPVLCDDGGNGHEPSAVQVESSANVLDTRSPV